MSQLVDLARDGISNQSQKVAVISVMIRRRDQVIVEVNHLLEYSTLPIHTTLSFIIVPSASITLFLFMPLSDGHSLIGHWVYLRLCKTRSATLNLANSSPSSVRMNPADKWCDDFFRIVSIEVINVPPPSFPSLLSLLPSTIVSQFLDCGLMSVVR